MSNHDSASNHEDDEENPQQLDLDEEGIPQANEDDFIYLDEDQIEAMD
jgi:hypothetical protein